MIATWGDTVRVKLSAPADMRPGELASVVAIVAIEGAAQAERWGVGLGTQIFGIEFGDGVTIELPEQWLEREGAQV